jgi:acetylornithine deacetylase/succinyl-diaminopimelate desuccinylase-like protein
MMHPDFHKAVAYLISDTVRSLLMELVDISSPSGKEIGVAQYLVTRMRRFGMETDLPLVDAGRPNAVGHRRGRGNGLNLLFTGHMDTSYSGQEQHLAGEGFQPKAIYRDGWVWGLGANNMKSGLAAALIAIEAIAEAGIELPGDISFGGVVGEIEKTAVEEFQGVEYSGYGIGTRHLVTHGVTADFALLAEPTGLKIAIANMGVIWLRITVSHRSAPLRDRHECRCTPSLDAAAGEFYAKWRSHVQLAPNESCFDLWAWVIYERTERQNANSSSEERRDGRRGADHAMRPFRRARKRDDERGRGDAKRDMGKRMVTIIALWL